MFSIKTEPKTASSEGKSRVPNSPAKLKPQIDRNLITETSLKEYRQIASEIGISDQDILVEEFRIFLSSHDIAVFNYQEVISYMDEVAKRDNPTGFGWHWCPVRVKDTDIPMAFGRRSEDRRQYNNEGNIAASDYYSSHAIKDWHGSGGGGWVGNAISGMAGTPPTIVNVTSNVETIQAAHDAAFQKLQPQPRPVDWRSTPSPAYTRTLPLHVLKKIAFIEREFKEGHPVFLVTDYTIKADIIINPDPFLMAVIPNSAVAHGKGRFIIDMWDEPGFGLDRMLK